MTLHVSSTVVLNIRRSILYYTAPGIITHVRGRPVHRLREFSCEQDQDGTVLILLASCQQTCMTYTIAMCTVKNS